MRIVAVVVSYWPERRDNVVRIVADLLASSRPPDAVMVLDNAGILTPWHERLPDDRVSVIRPGQNTETRGKFVAGLLDPADAYVLADDDTSVGPETIAACLRWAEQLPGPEFVFGYWGVQLDPTGSFSMGTIITLDSILSPVPVDAFHGRVIVCSFGALVAMLGAEATVRLGTSMSHVGDDLLIGLANPGASWALPLRGAEAFVDLDQGGVAMQHREGYFEERDRFCRQALSRLRASGDGAR